MIEVKIKDAALQQAPGESMDAFLKVFIDAIRTSIGGELTAETIGELTADQVTLLAWDTLHPFAKAVKLWGMRDLSKLVYDAHTLWLKHRDVIERDLTEDEFMALFEQLPEFDDLDDTFIENEEEWTSMIAHYVDDHIENFATIEL